MRSLRHTRMPRSYFTGLRGMEALAGLAFVLLFFYIILSRSFLTVDYPPVNLPTALSSPCLPDSDGRIIVTIQENGRLFFQTQNKALLAPILARAAADQNVPLTDTQRKKLERISFLGLSLQQLPDYTGELSVRRQILLNQQGISRPDLIRCIKAVKSISGGKPFLLIRADKDVSYLQLKQLVTAIRPYCFRVVHLQGALEERSLAAN